MARPEIEIDPIKLDAYLSAGCNLYQTAAKFKIHPETLSNWILRNKGSNFSSYSRQISPTGEADIKLKMHTLAMKGNTRCLIELYGDRVKAKENLQSYEHTNSITENSDKIHENHAKRQATDSHSGVNGMDQHLAGGSQLGQDLQQPLPPS